MVTNEHTIIPTFHQHLSSRQRYFTKSIITESLRRADILKLNEEELTAVTGLLGYQLAGE